MTKCSITPQRDARPGQLYQVTGKSPHSSTGRELSADLSIRGDVQVARGMVRRWEQAAHATATKSLIVVRLVDIRLGKQDRERANDA